MDSKKHICLIYEFLSEQGGLEREIINHANFLKEDGYEVTILTCHLDKRIMDLLPFKGLKVEELSVIKTPYESFNLFLCFLGINKIRKYNPDAFLSYSFPCNYLIRKKKNKRINYINHYPHFLYLSMGEKIEWAASTQGIKRWISILVSLLLGNYLKKVDRKLVKKNDLNFVNSKFSKKRIDKLYSINSILSYPPIDPKFRPVKIKSKDKFVFSSSRIIPDKKYEWLIEAMSHTKNKAPLYIAGSVKDTYKKRLSKLAEEINVKLVFLGKLDTNKIREYYSAASVFAFPTPKEDFGLVPAESLSCGTPVVAWRDGAGPTEQIIENVNGYLAEPYNLKDFAKKIDLCISTNFKIKRRKQILKSAEKFSYSTVKKSFLKTIKDFIF